MSRPGLWRMLRRGAVRRCPWCGGRGAFFTGWFSKADSCRSCGLRWRRGDVGYELGAAAVAAIIVMGPLIVAIGVIVAITWPEVAVVPMLVVLAIGGVVLSLLAYPVSYTLWQALDLAMRPAEPDHFDVEVVAGAGDAASPDVRPTDA